MDNLADALQFVANQNQTINERRQIVIAERPYYFAGDALKPIHDPMPAAIHVRTLTGIVDYIAGNPDGLIMEDMTLHVASHNTVELFGPLAGAFEQRPVFLDAKAMPGGSDRRCPLDTYIEAEDAILWISANVVPDQERDDLLRALAAIQIDDGGVLTDDGVSQTVAMKTGARLVDKGTLKSRIVIRPYSTFSEIEQPAREFVLRLDKGGRPGLFSADGDRWKATAMQSIKEWLQGKSLPCKLIA